MSLLNKYALIILIIVVSISTASGQKKSTTEIHIGDKLPDIEISGFLNDSLKKVSLHSLYNHKLLLLDFWATWCVACIEKFPMLDSIKNEFGDKIEIVSVGYEPYNTINRFFKNKKIYKPQYLKIIGNDKLLSYGLFPHRSIPHVVWIDSTGKVITITEGENVTSENLRKALSNEKLALHPKVDKMDFDATKTFHLRDSTFMGRSIFTNHTDGIGSGINVTYETDNHHLIDRILAYNLSIRQLYWLATCYNKTAISNFGRIYLEVRDSLRFMQPSKVSNSLFKASKYYSTADKSDWDKDNLYCYEMQSSKPVSDTVAFRDMLADLNRNLNLNGRFEKRRVFCYVLKYKKRANNQLKISHSKSQIIYHNFGIPKLLQAQNINTLTAILNNGINNGQIVNETGLDSDKLFDFDVNDYKLGITPDQINEMINKYGLYLEVAKRQIPVVVISEL